MSCFRPKKSKTRETRNDSINKIKHDILLRIPECRVHLIDDGEAAELAAGDLEVQRISDQNVALATAIKVGGELQWPLLKDEPVVKLDALHYLFTLPMKDGRPLSYGVSFAEKRRHELGSLDAFLKENSVFTVASSRPPSGNIDWKEFAPAVEGYNGVLAKAIAGGTGKIVQGIFKCSNAYTNQVQKGGETILIRAVEGESRADPASTNKNKGSLNKSLKQARDLSKMTEKLSKSMLNAVEGTSSSVVAPLAQSRAGKTLLSSLPGEVLLASLDSLNRILEAAEAAERQAMNATSGAITTAVSSRYGESAGETAEDALATAGHCASTAWNVMKIRKAINPATGIPNSAAKSIRR